MKAPTQPIEPKIDKPVEPEVKDASELPQLPPEYEYLNDKPIHHRTPEEQELVNQWWMEAAGFIPEDEYYNPEEFCPVQVDIEKLFPTNVVRGFLRTFEYDEIIEDCRSLVDQVKKIEGENTSKNYTTYFNEDIRTSMHEFDWFKKFSDQIKDTYIDYCRNVYAQELDHLSRNDIHLFAWVNVYGEEHSHEVHNHMDSNLSGTWYIKVDEDTSPIKFLSPNLMAHFSQKSRDQFHQRMGHRDMGFVGTNFVESEVHFQPQPSEFLLWPSYLQHMVPVNTEPQKENYERISLSFNLKHREEINNNTTGNDMSYEGKLDFLSNDEIEKLRSEEENG